MQPVSRSATRVEQTALASRAARRKRDEEVAKRRRQQMACAWRYLTEGEPHEKCVFHADPCSREYDPRPTREAFPEDIKLYEGTAIGYLYGFINTEQHAWQTAGWNIKRRRRV